MYPKPKKSLGQNFLLDPNLQRKIITACNFSPDDTVMEIGAGRGEFSRLIVPLVKKLIAVEIDRQLYPILKDNLACFKNAVVVQGDILKLSLNKYTDKKLKVFGNIPYYISSPIIERLFNYRRKISSIFLTVQKEFGRRCVALPGSKEFGSLSCFVQYYAKPQTLFTIGKGSFRPCPKVDSVFLRLQLRHKPLLKKEDEKRFFRITRAAFNQRRKILRNSLAGILPRRETLPRRRAEELGLEQFLALAKS